MQIKNVEKGRILRWEVEKSSIKVLKKKKNFVIVLKYLVKSF